MTSESKKITILPAPAKQKSWSIASNPSGVINELPFRINHTYSPKFDVGKGSYILEGISDKELQEIVGELSLTDDKGNIITKANKYNKLDPFFNHKSVRVSLTRNAKIFDLSNPLNRLHLSILKTYNILASSKAELNNGSKWFIEDKEREATKVINQATKAKECLETYNKLTAKQKRIVLAALSAQYPNYVDTRVTKNTGQDMVEAVLFNIATDSKIDKYGISPSDAFLSIAKEGAETLAIKSLIGRALNEAVIRKRGDKYFYKEDELASGYEALLNLLKSPDRQLTYEAIERDLELIEKR